MWVGEIDVHDDALLHRFWAAGKAGDEYRRPYAVFWPWRVAKVGLQQPTDARVRAVAARDGEDVVGACEVTLPIHDNRHIAYIEPIVRPESRNRGVGSALLGVALEVARREGRRVVIGEAHTPLQGEPSPGWRFMVSRGFSPDTSELHRVADLPVDPAVLDELAGEAAPHHSLYTFVQWGNRMPEEHVAAYCRLMSTFNAEAPIGDLELEPEHYDEQRIRARESKYDEQGRTWYSTAAIAPDGSVAGLTEMCISRDDDRFGWQDSTIVARAHRGHRLGLAVKVANLRRFQAEQPQATSIHSWNADVNAPMVAINDRLGFRPVERSAEMQLRL